MQRYDTKILQVTVMVTYGHLWSLTVPHVLTFFCVFFFDDDLSFFFFLYKR